MFSKILDFFQGEANLQVDASGDPTEEDLQIATAVLLLEVAGADEDYDPEEVRTCVKVMNEQFESEGNVAIDLMAKAEQLRKKAGKIDEFVNAINEYFSEKQRQLILIMAWRVIIADNKIDNDEHKFASTLRQRLLLSREQGIEAKEKALTETA